MMIAVALGSMLAAAAGSLWLFGSRSFVAMGNYQDLDKKSRNALDRMSQDLRQATQVTAFQKSGTTKLLTVTNAVAGVGITYTWKAT
jgi:Tfp pilus assembly protein PilW